MKLKLALATASALGLVMTTAALADGNKAHTWQDGSSNSATVTQAGGSNNQAGRSGDAMTQTGSNNVLVILQDGTGGEIGVKQGTDEYRTPPNNLTNPQYTLTYQGVNQTSTGLSSNLAVLTQDGNGSVIGEVQQNASGLINGNMLTVVQDGANTINHIFQMQNTGGPRNMASASQSGSGNVIDRIDQKASGAGTNNIISVNISGTNNGTMDLTGIGGFYSSRAWAMGATQSALIQNNYGNTYGVNSPSTVEGNMISLSISGSGNQYGMTQKGSGNTTGAITISGSNNSFGSYQAGQGNEIGAGEIAGSNNDVGVWQAGTSNDATVSVLAYGSNFNALSIAQQGTDNSATANITGSHNGEVGFGGVASALVSANPLHLHRGTIVQGSSLGSGNNIANLTIYGSSNAFAIASLGSGNEVTGKIGTSASSTGISNGNSAAVLQNGNNNVAAFSQTGAGTNSVAISQ